MPSGCVVEYKGKRGKVFRIKYADASGKQVMETLGREADGWSKKQAKEVLGDRLSDVRRKGWRRPQPVTFREATCRWFEETEARKQWKPSTVMEYRGIVARLNARFGARRVGELRSADVSKYATDALGKLAAATVSRDLSILHSILAWAVVNELVERNVADGVPHPKAAQRKGLALTPAQVQLLARSFDDEQARTAFLTFVLTGVRRAELQALRWRDIDLIENVLRVADSKTETGVRAVALSPSLAEELWQHRRRTAYAGDDERVFCHREQGTIYRYEWYKAALERAFKKAGLVWPERFRPCHDLRVTAITNDAIAGAHPIAIMTKAGHASMATTKRYLKLAGVVFRDEAQALEERLLGRLSTEPSTDLREPQPTGHDPAPRSEADPALSDAV
jgi:integrase